jgi:hypothetical protein
MSFMSNAIHVSVNSCLIIDLLHPMSYMSLMFKAPTVVNYDVPNMPQISPLFAYAPTTPHPHDLDIEAAARVSTAVDSVRRLGRSCCVSMTLTMYGRCRDGRGSDGLEREMRGGHSGSRLSA